MLLQAAFRVHLVLLESTMISLAALCTVLPKSDMPLFLTRGTLLGLMESLPLQHISWMREEPERKKGDHVLPKLNHWRGGVCRHSSVVPVGGIQKVHTEI